eukprot:6412244-Prorocentrum_lima.AAC.1
MTLVRETVRAPFFPCPPLPPAVASSSFGKAAKIFHARTWAASVGSRVESGHSGAIFVECLCYPTNPANSPRHLRQEEAPVAP